MAVSSSESVSLFHAITDVNFHSLHLTTDLKAEPGGIDRGDLPGKFDLVNYAFPRFAVRHFSGKRGALFCPSAGAGQAGLFYFGFCLS